MTFKKVRQYHITSKIADKEDQELYKEKNAHISERVFIFGGKEGVVVSVEKEGVHSVFKDENELYEVSVRGLPDKEGCTPMFPIGSIEIEIKEIVEKCEYKEVDLCDTVRTFGARLDTNYAILLRSLKEIDFDTSEYNTNRQRRGGA